MELIQVLIIATSKTKKSKTELTIPLKQITNSEIDIGRLTELFSPLATACNTKFVLKKNAVSLCGTLCKELKAMLATINKKISNVKLEDCVTAINNLKRENILCYHSIKVILLPHAEEIHISTKAEIRKKGYIGQQFT